MNHYFIKIHLNAILVFILLTYIHNSKSMASIDPLTGRFSETWTDYQSGNFLWQRTYNAGVNENSNLGRGWCLNWTPILKFISESEILYSVCGSGRQIKFLTHSDGKINHFLNDLFFLNTQSSEISSNSISYSNNTKYFIHGIGPEYIIKNKNVFELKLNSSSSQFFDEDGKLVKSSNLKDTYEFQYKANKLTLINSQKFKIKINYNEQNLISLINTDKGNIQYFYNNKNNLIKVKSLNKKEINFGYDENSLLNKIEFKKNDVVKIKINPTNGRVKEFTDRSLCLHQFKAQTKDGKQIYSDHVKCPQTSFVKKYSFDKDNKELKLELKTPKDKSFKESLNIQVKNQSILLKTQNKINTKFNIEKARKISSVETLNSRHSLQNENKCNQLSLYKNSNQNINFKYNSKCQLTQILVNNQKLFNLFYKNSKLARVDDLIDKNKIYFNYDNNGKLKNIQNGNQLKILTDHGKFNIVGNAKMSEYAQKLVYPIERLQNLIKITGINIL